MKTTLSTPALSDTVRLTIPVSREVHEAFARIAAAIGMPLGRAMGDWLEDTLDAALFTAQKVEEARSAPALVLNEMKSLALGSADLADKALEDIRKMGREARAGGTRSAASAGTPDPVPPSCNTGGKVPKKGSK